MGGAAAAGGAAGAEGAPATGHGDVGQSLVRVDTRDIGAYRVETWAVQEEGWARETMVRVVPPLGDPFVVNDARVRLVAQEGPESWEPRAVAYEPGDDLTGDGVPNLLIEGYSMGAHCCFSYHLLALGETLEVLWAATTRDSAIVLVDLEGDGGRQILMRDMSFAYEFCSFADSPAPPVVLRLDDAGATIANAAYQEAYRRDVVSALAAALDEPQDRPEVHRCRVAQLVLVLLYGGHDGLAERALERLYLGDDGDAFREALWSIALASPWYRAPGNGP
jgi:hypothetical protein